MPSTLRLRFSWNSMTASRVPVPNSPSWSAPMEKPSAESRPWMSRTGSPESPIRRSRIGPYRCRPRSR